jgi:thiol:disulfide interchange protein DsbA
MKNIFFLAAALLLVACGSDDPAPSAVAEDPVTESAAEEVEAPATDEIAENEVIEVVEESAAEADPEEEVILLAQADTSTPPANWQFRENEHFVRLVPTQPTVGGADKIEVAEFFWYGCPHCYTFEPYINEWAADKPANVRFVRVPAMWNRGLELHAQLYYTEEVLAANGVIKDPAAFREAVFVEYHRRGNRLGSKEAIQTFFSRFDVGAEDFERAWTSFEVNQKMRVAADLARRYGIASVPMVVVNGKYRTSGTEAGSLDTLLEVIDELVVRESVR